MKTEKNRIARKLYEWMWFIITLAPFIICLFTSFNDGFFAQQSLESALNVYTDHLHDLFQTTQSSWIQDLLYHFFSLSNDMGDPIFAFPDLVLAFASYLVSVEIIRIIVDLLLWVPRFLQKQLNKGVK